MNLEHALHRFGRDNVARVEFDEDGQVVAVDLVDHSQVLLSKADAPVGVAVTGAPRDEQVPFTVEAGTPPGAKVFMSLPAEPLPTVQALVAAWRIEADRFVHRHLTELELNLRDTDRAPQYLIDRADAKITNDLSELWDNLLQGTLPEE